MTLFLPIASQAISSSESGRAAISCRRGPFLVSSQYYRDYLHTHATETVSRRGCVTGMFDIRTRKLKSVLTIYVSQMRSDKSGLGCSSSRTILKFELKNVPLHTSRRIHRWKWICHFAQSVAVKCIDSKQAPQQTCEKNGNLELKALYLISTQPPVDLSETLPAPALSGRHVW